MTATRRIKCRFCNFRVTPFYHTKGGQARNWFTRMAAHIEYAHPDESKRIKRIEEENVQELREQIDR